MKIPSTFPRLATLPRFEPVDFSDDVEPASAPTMLIDMSDEFGPESSMTTSLPGPPPMPELATFEPRLSASAVPRCTVARPTVRMATVTKLRLIHGMRPSGPPTAPPPQNAMRRAA